MATMMLTVENDLRNSLHELELLTVELRKAAGSDDWSHFGELLTARQALLQRIEQQHSRLLVMIHPGSATPPAKSGAVSADLKAQMKKVTKVNNEVLDIINEKKQRLLESMANVNKGLEFLKYVERNVNSEKLISKVY